MNKLLIKFVMLFALSMTINSATNAIDNKEETSIEDEILTPENKTAEEKTTLKEEISPETKTVELKENTTTLYKIPEKTIIIENWLNDNEIQQLKTALDPNHPNCGGIVPGKHHRSQTEVDNKTNKHYITKAYYAMLKEKLRKGFKRSFFSDGYSTKKELDVKQTLRLFPKKIMTQPALSNAWKKFQNVSDQRSWPKWFEEVNDTIMIEIMFDYLAAFDDANLKRIFKEWLNITSRIEMIKRIRQINFYKKSNMYRGSDTARKDGPSSRARKLIIRR